MTKHELVDAIAKRGYTKKAAKEILDDVFNVIAEHMCNGEEVPIHGFGTFSIAEAAEKVVTNPHNRAEKITIPAHIRPKFTAGKLLRDGVQEGVWREQ